MPTDDELTPDPTTDTDAGGDTPPETGKGKGEKTFTQAELDAIVADRIKRQEESAKKKAKIEADKAAEAQLAEAADWQKLADKRAEDLKAANDQLAALEQEKAKAEKYGQSLSTYVEKLSEGLPESILALLEPMDAADKLSWLSTNAAQFIEEGDAAEEPAADRTKIPATPKPSNGKTVTNEERRKRAARTF